VGILVTGIGRVNRKGRRIHDEFPPISGSAFEGRTPCYADARSHQIKKEKAVLGKIILWVSALMFIGYGLACVVSPALPTQYAGLGMNTGDAYAEIGAMYGGLQTGFGLFCLFGALRKDFYRPALASLVLLVGGLALARTYSALTGVEAVGSYTHGAMVYEFSTFILSAIALRNA
jgi:hypothetical protein